MVTVTRSETTSIGHVIGVVIRDRITELRKRSGLSRDELAEAAREHGAGESMTANVVGFLERGRRGITVDELLAIAAALEVSPLELLGDQAPAFVGSQTPPGGCPRCDGGGEGPAVTAVRAAAAQLGDLSGVEQTLVAAGYALAGQIDAVDGETAAKLPGLVRELRAVLRDLAAGRAPKPGQPTGTQTPAADDWSDLGEPE